MGVSPANPQQQAAVPFFGHTEILNMLVSMGSTALAAAVVLPRYGGLNYACGINEDWKRKNSCCIILYNFVKILNKSTSFTTNCIMATESHRECLINTCINGWRHGIEYTQVQKLSNLSQKCTYVQPSIIYFHKTAAGAVLFTGLPPFNLKSVSQYSIPMEYRQETCPMYVKLTSFAFVMSQ